MKGPVTAFAVKAKDLQLEDSIVVYDGFAGSIVGISYEGPSEDTDTRMYKFRLAYITPKGGIDFADLWASAHQKMYRRVDGTVG